MGWFYSQLPDTSSDPELHLDSIQRRKLWFALPGEVQEVLNMTSDVPNIPLSKSMMATIIHFQGNYGIQLYKNTILGLTIRIKVLVSAHSSIFCINSPEAVAIIALNIAPSLILK